MLYRVKQALVRDQIYIVKELEYSILQMRELHGIIGTVPKNSLGHHQEVVYQMH